MALLHDTIVLLKSYSVSTGMLTAILCFNFAVEVKRENAAQNLDRNHCKHK